MVQCKRTGSRSQFRAGVGPLLPLESERCPAFLRPGLMVRANALAPALCAAHPHSPQHYNRVYVCVVTCGLGFLMPSPVSCCDASRAKSAREASQGKNSTNISINHYTLPGERRSERTARSGTAQSPGIGRRQRTSSAARASTWRRCCRRSA